MKNKILLLKPGEQCEIARGDYGHINVRLKADGLYYAYEFAIMYQKDVFIDRYPLSKIDGLISYIETWYIN